jgi:NTE family protein
MTQTPSSRTRKSKPRPTSPRPNSPRPLNIALQGGGSHGAFAWGILDALLEEGRFEIAAITATSAGAMNAVVCADGYRLGGPDTARQALDAFWKRISQARGPFSPVSLNAIKKAFDPFGVLKGAAFQWFDALTRVASPYEFNPWNFNPLRDALEDSVDFDGLRAAPPFKLFVAATGVKSGRAKVFRGPEISANAVLASACLPYLFQAVEVDGEAYWDGGYMANPALWPLFYDPDLPCDLLLCALNPMRLDTVPKTSVAIMDRLNEITFNASLIAELRAIAFVQKLVRDDAMPSAMKERYRNVLVHAIKADDALANLGAQSKFNTDWHFLTGLRDKGRAAWKAWSASCGDQVGHQATVDLARDFLDR